MFDLLTEEAIVLEKQAENPKEDTWPVYIALTDTKTLFSKLAKHITKQPYNHVSVSFTEALDVMYSYDMSSPSNAFGGFVIEDRKNFKGADYSLYVVYLEKDKYDAIKDKIKAYAEAEERGETGYYYPGLINAVFQKKFFDDEKEGRRICSSFVYMLLEDAGTKLFKRDEKGDIIRPYDFAKSKLTHFVKRGKM